MYILYNILSNVLYDILWDVLCDMLWHVLFSFHVTLIGCIHKLSDISCKAWIPATWRCACGGSFRGHN